MLGGGWEMVWAGVCVCGGVKARLGSGVSGLQGRGVPGNDRGM